MSRSQRQYDQPKTRPRLYYGLIGLTTLLLLLGIIAVYDASVYEAFVEFNDKFHFARQQLIWAAVGLLLLFITSRLPTSLFKRLATPVFLLALLMMVLVLIPGLGYQVQGARRWLRLGGIQLQPSEFLKPALIFYLAAWLQEERPLLSFLFIMALVLGLTLLQPDLGTTVVLATTGFLLYYLAGANTPSILVLFLGGLALGALLILSSPYRRERLSTFLDPTQDPLGSSYHINQVLIALGSGGWTGVGLGRSRQKYRYLPEATTDSIFAIIAEETGFLGASLVIALLAALSFIGLRLAHRSENSFHQLLAGGISGWLAIQTLLNISAMVALVPLTGVPLPLISYGGSSLLTTLTSLGVLASVARAEKL